VRRLLREPLLHFLGGLLFALYTIVVDAPAYAPDRIVVDQRRIASLSAAFERTWMRPPSRVELEELIGEFVNEEILYREALALGFDRDDSVIRRRMRQKMEFLHADLAELETPSEAPSCRRIASVFGKKQEFHSNRFTSIRMPTPPIRTIARASFSNCCKPGG